MNKKAQKNVYFGIVTAVLLLVSIFISLVSAEISPNPNLNGLNQFTIKNYSQLNNVLYVTANSATDIQTKYNTASLTPNSKIVIPAGTYNINQQINITGNVKVVCDSPTNTHLNVNTTFAFWVSEGATVDFTNCHFTSNGVFTSGKKVAIFLSEFGSGSGTSIANRDLNASIYFDHNIVENVTAGIRYKTTNGLSGDIIITNNEFMNFNDQVSSGQTFEVVSIQAQKPVNKKWLIENNFFHDITKNESKAIAVNGDVGTDDANTTSIPSYPRSIGVTISNNKVYNVSSDGIYVHTLDQAIVTGNQVYYYGQKATTHQVGIAANNIVNSIISNNVVEYGSGRAIRTEFGDHNTISNNILIGGSNVSNTWEGYIFRITSSDSSFVDNKITGYRDPVIRIDGDRNIVARNVLFGTNTSIQDLGYNNSVYGNTIARISDVNTAYNLGESDPTLALALNFNNDSISNGYVLDSSLNHYDGTEANSPTWCSNCGVYGTGSYIFNTTNSISIPNNNNLELGSANSPFTISLWINSYGAGVDNLRWAAKSGSQGGWKLQGYTGGGGIRLLLTNKTNSVITTVADTNPINRLINNEWIMYTWTSDGTTYKLYRNGKFASSAAVNSSDNITGISAFNIGANSGGATGMNGSIDNFRLYHRALSDTEISDLYSNKISPATPFLSRSGGTIQGILTLARPPVTCPAGSFMTYFNGATSTCTSPSATQYTNLTTSNMTILSNLIFTNSTGSPKWRIYVNDSGSLITESI